MRRIDVSLNYDIIISENDIDTFQGSLDRLKNHEPIQYIIGETEFFCLPFKVDSSVLIPRPETEELVDWMISELRIKKPEIRILDIGTGSGCIAIALSKNIPNAIVFGLDVSKEALKVAKENAILNNIKIEFIEADVFNYQHSEPSEESQKYNVIVSNPPYIRALEKKQMQDNVLDFEPPIALFVEDEDSLLFYRKITQLANKILKPKGELFFEINEYLGLEMVKLLMDEGFVEVELKQDIFGKDRMIKGVKL